jgi:NADH:ubiquinone oxidoreductase subunit 2 (subunit N)
LYSVFGLYYYLKMANAMFMGQPQEKGLLPVSWTMRMGLAVTAFATLFIGIMPDRFINIVNWSLGLARNPAVARLVH